MVWLRPEAGRRASTVVDPVASSWVLESQGIAARATATLCRELRRQVGAGAVVLPPKGAGRRAPVEGASPSSLIEETGGPVWGSAAPQNQKTEREPDRPFLDKVAVVRRVFHWRKCLPSPCPM